MYILFKIFFSIMVYHKIFLNVSKIALECCVGFCCTTVRISCMCTYVLFLPPLHPTPSRVSRSTELSSLCYIAASHWLFYTRECIYVNATLSIHPPSFPHCVHVSVLYMCVSVPALQIGSSAPFFYNFCSSNQKGI